MPVIRACGQRRARSSVELPGPQPISTTCRGSATGTCASRSRAAARPFIFEFQVLLRIPVVMPLFTTWPAVLRQKIFRFRRFYLLASRAPWPRHIGLRSRLQWMIARRLDIAESPLQPLHPGRIPRRRPPPSPIPTARMALRSTSWRPIITSLTLSAEGSPRATTASMPLRASCAARSDVSICPTQRQHMRVKVAFFGKRHRDVARTLGDPR